MPGFIFIGGTATRVFQGITAGTASGTNFTFSSVPFGTAEGNSLVAVLACVWSTGNDVVLSTVPIGGTNGTIHIQAQGKDPVGTRTATCGIISRATASTSGQIDLNCSASNQGAAIAVYRLNNLISSTPDATASAISAASGAPSSPLSTTINITGPSVLLQLICETDAAPSSIVGTTQDGSTTTFPTSTNIGRLWTGSEQALPAEIARVLSAINGANTASMVACAWH